MKIDTTRRWGRLATALTMLATLVSPMVTGNGTPVQAKTDMPSGFRNVRPTTELLGPELAAGVLEGDVEGNDLQVYVYATPPTPKDIPDGYQPPPEVPVGVGEVTDTSFRVVADPSVELTDFLNESGRVEFRAVGSSSDYYGMWVFDRKLDANGQIVEPRPSGPEFVASDSGELTTVKNRDAITLDVSVAPSKGSSVTADIAGIASGSDCNVAYLRKWTMVGATFHRTAGMPLTLTYREGSQTDIDVGVFYQGRGWSIGGSVTKMNNSSYGTQWTTTGREDRFHYTTHRVKRSLCNYQCTSGPSCWYHHQEYRVVTHLGGNPSGRAQWGPRLQRRYCSPFYPEGPGYEYIVNNSTATKFRAGVDVGPIKLGAQTGYDTATAILGNSTQPRLVCGWTGPPPSPGVATVGYRS